MSLFWLRVAAVLYSAGLLYALSSLWRRSERWYALVLALFSAGVILHLVSVVEQSAALRHLAVESLHQTLSFGALLLAVVFLLVTRLYEFRSLSIAVFPLVFAMTLIATTAEPVSTWTDTNFRDAWLLTHVVLMLAGLVAVFLMALTSVFYLIQERNLKNKSTSNVLHRLPPLSTLDSLSWRTMNLGFVFITLGVVTGSIWAYIESGTRWVGEGQVHISLFTWLSYLVLVFLRVAMGWRGRRAAFLSLYVLLFSALTWLSHSGLRPLLAR